MLQTLWLGRLEYRAAWNLQRRLAQARRAGEIEDTLLLLEHPPVYTMGRNGDQAHLGRGEGHLRALGADYVEVDRGGSVTFHGPGQLVAYPVVRLAGRFPIPGNPDHGDVDHYLRALETALIRSVSGLDIVAVRRPPYTGIWIEPEGLGSWHKLAAIGVKLAGGVTTHGVALNVTTDLDWFAQVIPCGIADAGVCSLESLAGHRPAVETVAGMVAAQIAAAFNCRPAPADARLLGLIESTLGVPAKAV